MSTRVLAVDCGATSIRVCAVELDEPEPRPQVVHRHRHAPVRHSDGSLRWDWPAVVAAIEHGLHLGIADGPVASIGVDTWGVDYGLLDERGRLLSDPWSYRSERTDNWQATVEQVGADRLYDVTGIQLMPINTIFQLAVHDRRELDRAHRLLMLPELVVDYLTGNECGEVTSAGTSGLLDARDREWAHDLVADIGVDPDIVPELRPAGSRAGSWQGVPVHLVAGHDTASAVAALPQSAAQRPAFVCTGSWTLVGCERPTPDLSGEARAANFSNEPAVYAGVRFLKNVPGFVLLERLREQLHAKSVAELLDGAAERPAGQGMPLDAEVVGADDLAGAIRLHGEVAESADDADVVRSLVDGLAAGAAAVVEELGLFLGGPVDEVRVVGGGVRARPFVHRLEELTGVPVRLGSAEATAVGNALVQAHALGVTDGWAVPSPTYTSQR